MSLAILDGPTIPQGESLSEGIDCSGGSLVRITCPAEFTRANMTFQVSSDGLGYNDLHDAKGNEVTITAKPDTGIVIEEKWGRVVGWLKLRSGTRASPVNQKVDCRFAIAIEVEDGAPAALAARGTRQRE